MVPTTLLFDDYVTYKSRITITFSNNWSIKADNYALANLRCQAELAIQIICKIGELLILASNYPRRLATNNPTC
jgi:hypothetical protein